MKNRTFAALIMIMFFSTAAAAGLYKDNGDGTVTDTETELIWQKSEGGAHDWKDAMAYCENLVAASRNDWRLPSLRELRSIRDESKSPVQTDMKFFPDAKPVSYWSSTEIPYYEGISSFYVPFGNEGELVRFITYKHQTRCVRGRKLNARNDPVNLKKKKNANK